MKLVNSSMSSVASSASCVARLHLGVRWQDRLDLGDELLGRDALLAAAEIASSSPTLSNSRWAFGSVEHREGGAPERVDRAVLRDAGDREALDGPRRRRRRSVSPTA